MNKTIKKLKEEFIPKRIERAIETLEEKIKLGLVKANLALKTSLLPIQESLESLK